MDPPDRFDMTKFLAHSVITRTFQGAPFLSITEIELSQELGVLNVLTSNTGLFFCYEERVSGDRHAIPSRSRGEPC